MFSKREADKLPLYRGFDYKIELKLGTIPTYGPLYSILYDKLEVLRDYLKDNLEKGFIRILSSPALSPILFAKKLGGGLRFYIDYRKLNEITLKDRYPIPLI